MSYRPWFEEHIEGCKWAKNGQGMGFCPFHEDKRRSLSLDEIRGLWYCHACAIGGTAFSLAEKLGVSSPEKSKKAPVACYIYTDEKGGPLFRILRGEQKKFWAERYLAGGGWESGIKGVRLVPYKLKAFIQSSVFIIIVEGEKDAETLIKLGFVATTNPFGAGKWREEFNRYFQERDVVILPDNDDPGRKHGDDVRRSLSAIAKRVAILNLFGLPDKGDVTDWMGLEHTGDELLKMCEEVLYGKASEQEVKAVGGVAISSPPEPAKAPALEAGKKLPAFPEEAWVGLLDDYRKLVGPTSEAPDAYHFATIVAVLGLYLGRDFYICHPQEIFQNYYFLLLGKSGLSGKSISIGYGLTLLRALDESIKYSSALGSAEGIFYTLAATPRSRLLLFNDELRTLFANAQRITTQNIFSSLNTIYSLGPSYTVTKKDPLTVKEGMMTMISATPPEWMSQKEEVEAAYGGFLNRHVCFSGNLKGPIDDPAQPDSLQWLAFIKKIKEWRDLLPKEGGKIIKGGPAKSTYKDWYGKWRKDIDNLPEAISSILTREREHVIKLSAFYSLINCRMKIEPEDVELAIKIIDHSRSCVSVVFQDITLSRRGRLEERIKRVLASGPLGRRLIQQKVGGHYDRDELSKALKALDESGEIWCSYKDSSRGPSGWKYGLVIEEE